MAFHANEYAIKSALLKHTGHRALKICEFYYQVGDGIYTICHKTGFVVCLRGYTRSKVARTPDGFLIWKMDVENTAENRQKLKTAIAARNRAPYMEVTEFARDFESDVA